jgi:hypothetical protein
MGSFKGDIQATRIGAATASVIIPQPVRLRGIIIAGLATSGLVELKNYKCYWRNFICSRRTCWRCN